MIITKIISDKSDALYEDRQTITNVEGKFVLEIFYCCTQCGGKNPFADLTEELTREQILKREGLHEELKDYFNKTNDN